jgi:hypothetical protein
MNDLPTVRWLLRLLVNPGWAPLGVVVMHLALAHYGLTHRFDHLLHFLGGASIAYFLLTQTPSSSRSRVFTSSMAAMSRIFLSFESRPFSRDASGLSARARIYKHNSLKSDWLIPDHSIEFVFARPLL